METWETAVFYHLVHAVVLLVTGFSPGVSKVATIGFAAGIVVFSGSLYLLSVTNLTWLGAITPIGGVAFLVGWAALVLRPGKKRGDGSGEGERREAAGQS